MSIPIALPQRVGLLRSNLYIQAFLIGLLLTGLSIGVSGLITGSFSVPVWEVGATVLNYASFYLCVKQKRAYYIIGMVGYLFFVVVYLQANLVASTALSAYLSIALIVGWFMWGKDSDPLPVTRVGWRWWPVYIAVTAVAYIGAVALVTALGGSFPFWDGVILVFTILAQILLDRKKIENWAVWIVFVNGVGTVFYFSMGLHLIAIQQLLFGFFSVWGWIEWNKSRKTKPVFHNPSYDFGMLQGYAERDAQWTVDLYNSIGEIRWKNLNK